PSLTEATGPAVQVKDSTAPAARPTASSVSEVLSQQNARPNLPAASDAVRTALAPQVAVAPAIQLPTPQATKMAAAENQPAATVASGMEQGRQPNSVGSDAISRAKVESPS